MKIGIKERMAALLAALLATGCGGDGGSDSQPRLQGMRFGRDAYEVRIGKSVQAELRLTIDGSETAYDLFANPFAVTFVTDDPAVAQVRADGMITGVGYGTTRLVANTASLQTPATATIRVAPEALRLDRKEYELTPGKTLRVQLIVTQNGSESASEGNFGFVWRTEDPTIATVADDGTLTAVGFGTTTLTGTSPLFDQPLTATIRVRSVALRLDSESYLLSPGATVRVKLFVTEDGTESPTENLFGVVWQTTDPAVATVAADGTLTGVGFGTTTLTGTSALLEQPLTATVVVQLDGLHFESEQYLLEKDGVVKPRLMVRVNGAEVAVDPAESRITCRIEDTSIASLASDGSVRGLKTGATRLIASTPYYPEEVSTVIAVRGEWTGEWMLSLWNDSDALSGTVYMALDAGGTFTLYQSLDVSGFAVYRGTYRITERNGKNIFAGTYDDGTAWASEYEIARDGDRLQLTSLSDGAVSIYLLTQIPDYVKDGVTGAPAFGVRKIACKRFL